MNRRFFPLLVTGLLTFGFVSACDSSPSNADDENGLRNSDDPVILLVANKSDNTLSWLDVDSGEVLGTTSTGSGPHEVTVTPDGRWAFVANYEGTGDSISLIDVDKMEEVKRIPIDPYHAPHGIQSNADG
jgi:DNA-binding beta-propeller fold protein YncE